MSELLFSLGSANAWRPLAGPALEKGCCHVVRKEAWKVLVISAVELRGLSWLGPQKDVVFLNPYETLC